MCTVLSLTLKRSVVVTEETLKKLKSKLIYMYRLHHDVEVGMGFTQQGQRPKDTINSILTEHRRVQLTCTMALRVYNIPVIGIGILLDNY